MATQTEPPPRDRGQPWPVAGADEAMLWADFLEHATEGLHQADASGRILWANHAEAAMLGYARDEYIGHSVRDLHVDPAAFDAIWSALQRGETVTRAPARLRARDGSVRDVLVSASARMDGDRLVHTRSFTTDITERRNIDQARQAARDLLDTMVDGFMHIGRDWRVTYANPIAGGANRPGMKQRLEGSILWESQPHVVGTEFESRYREAMDTGERSTFEAFYPATGAWFENTVLPVEDGLWLYYRDVTDRHRMADLLEGRNRQHAAVARLGQVALSTRDLDTLLSDAARETAVALGVEFCKVLKVMPDGSLLVRAGHGWRTDVVGKVRLPAADGTMAGFTLGSDTTIVTDFATETRFRPTPLLLEHGIVSGMGVVIKGPEQPYGVLSVHSATRRTFNEDDIHFLQSVANLLASAIERTQVDRELRRHRDHLEELVRDRTRLLEESNKELEAFSYSVSHDLRAPLRTMGGFSDLLLRRHGGELKPEVRELLGYIHEGAIRMGQLIEDLLDLSRFHRISMVRQDVDLAAVAREVVAGLQKGHPGRQVEVTVAPALKARGDPQLLRVVLDNLLGNAWKFTQGTARPRIEVGSQTDGGETVYFVRDNGAGFDNAFVDQLFRPFHRLHKPSEFEGNGIGLATVARIVQRHGGKVWAEGVPGKGAIFRFTLPG
ncbi:MAG TPA: PAS domain-containing protein [Candidatus Thermoplasmatota archaeon]|nr:PAS domain-containing protein [Candidatus Thermoplasmatota archaeon]